MSAKRNILHWHRGHSHAVWTSQENGSRGKDRQARANGGNIDGASRTIRQTIRRIYYQSFLTDRIILSTFHYYRCALPRGLTGPAPNNSHTHRSGGTNTIYDKQFDQQNLTSLPSPFPLLPTSIPSTPYLHDFVPSVFRIFSTPPEAQ